MTTKSEWMQNLGLSGDSGYGGGGPKGPRPQLLGLTHESLSIKWEPASGIAIRQYVVELACVDEPGVPPEDDDWDLIYEDASPGCEISCLTGESEYCMRVAWVDLRGTQCAWGPTLKITTLPEPARKKKSPPKKKAAPPPRKAPPPPRRDSPPSGPAPQSPRRPRPPPSEGKKRSPRSGTRTSTSPRRSDVGPSPRRKTVMQREELEVMENAKIPAEERVAELSDMLAEEVFKRSKRERALQDLQTELADLEKEHHSTLLHER